MKIDIEKQKEFLSVLGAIDGQTSAINVTIENLNKELTRLELDKKDALVKCQHIDEDGQPAISGGALLVWCQICGTLLTEEEVNNLENFENKE